MRETVISILPLSRAHIACIAAYAATAAMLPFHTLLALVPLCLFLLLCAAAPFMPRWGFFLPVISRGPRHRRAVSITFDDGPDPLVTPGVLSLLRQYDARATFFVAGVRASEHSGLIRQILEEGHSIGNHTYHHNPWLMTKSSAEIEREIDRSQEILVRFGITPLALRPPAAVTNPKLWRMLLHRGMFCVNFSRRAMDMGNRKISGLAGRILRRLTAGDIIMLHDCAPGDPSKIPYLLEQFEEIMEGIQARGFAVIPLERLIGREIMLRHRDIPDAGGIPLASACRAASQSALFRRLPAAFPAERVRALSAPAGTTLVLDIQGNGDDGTDQGSTGGLHRYDEMIPPDPFGVIEDHTKKYGEILVASPLPSIVRDLSSLLENLRERLSPGGRLLCLMPTPSPAGIASSIGTSIKHGIMIRLRSAGTLERTARRAGFRECRVITEEAVHGRFYLLECTRDE